MKLETYNRYAAPMVRIALSLVFLWFGASQLIVPQDFIAYLPPFITAMPISPTLFVLFNGLFEVFFGTLLIAGIFTRISALALAGHLFGIAASLGLNQLGVRDFGLAFSTLSIVIAGPDALSLEPRLNLKARLGVAAVVAVIVIAIGVALGSTIAQTQ